MTEKGWTEERLIASIHGLTKGLRFARPQLRLWYDTWLKASGLPDAPISFAHAMVVTGRGSGLDPARDGDALCLALAALGGPQAVADCFAGAVAAGIFDLGATGPEPAFRSDLAQRMIAALGLEHAHAMLQRANTEALVDKTAFWTDPGNLLPGIILGRRRLCRIETRDEMGDRVTGSGFLIGPSVVITNFHVIKDMKNVPPEDLELSVRFDFSATTGKEQGNGVVFGVADDWLIADSETGPLLEEDYAWDIMTKRRAWLRDVNGFLDYAVIRLAGAPGLQRGWYNLEKVARDAPNGLWVLHHPGTEQHTITGGKSVYAEPGQTRIFHMATTAHGSSGGLALDQNGQPVGLHYLGLESTKAPPSERHNKAINVAVSLAAIADDLRQKNKLSALTDTAELNLSAGCLAGGLPVFGRRDYFRALGALWDGSKRVLRVHVTPYDTKVSRPGKSFSLDILQHFFAAPEHHYIVFGAGDIKVDAYRMACETLETFAPDAVASLPEAPDTTTPAYVRRLVSKFMQQVADRLSEKTVWIVLDDLDKHDLSDASGREFLATLYDQIGQQANLRLLLVGLREDVQIIGLDPDLVQQSAIDASALTDPSRLFLEWLDERGARDIALGDTGRAFLADIAGTYAGTSAPLERLSEFVTTYVAHPAERLFDKSGPNLQEPD